MEKLTAWMSGFFRQLSYQLDFSLFHFFDWFFLLFLVLGIVYGIKRGFLRGTVEFLEFFVVIFAVVGNYDWLSLQLTRWFSKLPLTAAKPICFFLILSTVWASVIVIDQNLKNLVQAKTFPPLRVVGGVMIGGIYFFFIFSLICKGLSLIPYEPISKLFNVGNTRFGHDLVQVPMDIYATVMKKVSLLIGMK